MNEWQKLKQYETWAEFVEQRRDAVLDEVAALPRIEVEAEGRFHIPSWRARQALYGGVDPWLKTTSRWLLRKRLISTHEFIAGEALGLLLEWRLETFSPPDSTVVFAIGYAENAPLMQCVPYEVEPVTINEEDRPARKDKSGNWIMPGERRDIDDTGMTTGEGGRRTGAAIAYELASERRAKHMFAGNELLLLEQLFLEALPEDPDLLGKLGEAVIDRIDVRDIPYKDVPLITSGLWLLKEYWREHLLRGEIDEATGLTEKASGKRAHSARRSPRGQTVTTCIPPGSTF